MSVILVPERQLPAPLLAFAPPTLKERPDVPDMVDELIASHRGALLELAPHQEERPQRVETGWHIAHLGMLLRVQQSRGAAQEVHNRHRAP